MEIFAYLRYILVIIPSQIVETPLIIGLVLFGLSWFSRRPWVALPRDARRRKLLVRLGIVGSLVVVATALTVGTLAAYEGYDETGIAGWWRRPAPMAAAIVAIGITAILLAREPLPAPGERAIAPRRNWWSFAPKAPLWCAAGAAVILALTSLWQASITSLLPNGAQMVGTPGPRGSTTITSVEPDEQTLPTGPFVDNPSGGGWLNNGVTLIALIALVAILLIALSRDANRPMPARSSAPSVRDSRETTAKMFVCISLASVLITLGMLWMFVGYIGGWSVTIEATHENAPGLAPDELGFISLSPSFATFAEVFRFGGWFLQGVGTALLLRLACDTWRASRSVRAAQQSPETAADLPIAATNTDSEAVR